MDYVAYWIFGAIVISLFLVSKEKLSQGHIPRAQIDWRADAIEEARRSAIALSYRGAIFEVTTSSSFSGYHIKELGWVSYRCEERSEAEKELKIIAAKKYKTSNSLTKLTSILEDERYQAGTGPNGNPYYRNQKVKKWEAMACEAIPRDQVDKSPIIWRDNAAVIDGSNVAYWGGDNSASLKPLIAVLQYLRSREIKPKVVFDANIGHRLSEGYLSLGDIQSHLGGDIEVEIVKAGSVADRRIIEIAKTERIPVVSNDLFKDSLLARHIPKSRGFYLPAYDYAEIFPPRV